MPIAPNEIICGIIPSNPLASLAGLLDKSGIMQVVFSGESGRQQAEKSVNRVRDPMRTRHSPLFEIALVLVRSITLPAKS